MNATDISVFSLNSGSEFATRVSASLGMSAGRHEEREFEDGEHKIRPLESVRGRDIFVVQSLYDDQNQSVNDKLCRLLFFIGALKDAAAARVTAVVPYLAYARKDRKTQSRDPVTTRYVAGMFESVGTDRVVTLDVHNLAAFQNAFRCATEHLEARMLFVKYFVELAADRDVVVVSPDVGGIKRADLFRQSLARVLDRDISMAFMEKRRALGVVASGALVGDVDGSVAIIIDDLISSGTTIARAADGCRAAGAKSVFAAATHGLFVAQADTVLAVAALDRIVVTDSVPPFRIGQDGLRNKLDVLDSASFIGEAIRRLHNHESLIALQQSQGV